MEEIKVFGVKNELSKVILSIIVNNDELKRYKNQK